MPVIEETISIHYHNMTCEVVADISSESLLHHLVCEKGPKKVSGILEVLTSAVNYTTQKLGGKVLH